MFVVILCSTLGLAAIGQAVISIVLTVTVSGWFVFAALYCLAVAALMAWFIYGERSAP